MGKPASNSKQDVAAYIREYIDPAGWLGRGDDAGQLIADWNIIWADEGGCGLTVEQVEEYLEGLSNG